MKILDEYIKYPLYILTHPINGFEELKAKGKKPLINGTIFLFLAAIVAIFEYKYTGFVVNKYNPSTLNSILTIVYTIAPVALISIGHWTVTTLIDGKASLINIYKVITYALFPLIICNILCIIISNFITTDEATFYYMLKFVGIFLTGFMGFMGLLVNQEFGLFKMIFSVILTIVAICIILFLMLIIFDLTQQIYGFIFSFYKELLLRIGTVILW